MLFFCLRKPRIEILIFQLISTRNYVNFWYLSTPRRSASIYWRNGPTKLGPRKSIFNFVKNGPILLIFGVWNQLMKRINHTKFQQNRTIFGPDQKFWDFFLSGPKVLRFCSNFVWWILWMSWFHTPNMSKIGSFLGRIKNFGTFFDPAQKWSDFAEIWCD